MSPSPVVRMLAASEWSQPGSAVEALLGLRPKLLQQAIANGVRTALLSSQGWLVQWHEGPAEAITTQRDAMQAEFGLASPRLLHGSHGPGLLAEPVQLASLQMSDPNGDMIRRLQYLQRQHEQGWDAEPVDVWKSLCAPCQLPGAWRPGLVGRREVVALVSDDNDAVELLRSVAIEFGARVAYQRYAGSDLQRRDVGAAYMDIEAGASMATRVQALSPRALGTGIDLLGLGQIDRFVLLVNPQSAQHSSLLADVARMVGRLATRPWIHLMCPCPASRAWAAQELRAACGVAVLPVDAPCTGYPAMQALHDVLVA
ncbi:hypothetical protein [Ramlibacter sp. AN1133]|uniref:hypothetical protein n=1 Tax=Ramlibacter sp. AN1133 TaxID=3133429 RepID=UPI0030C0BA20